MNVHKEAMRILKRKALKEKAEKTGDLEDIKASYKAGRSLRISEDVKTQTKKNKALLKKYPL